MDGNNTDIRVPIRARSNELTQLKTALPIVHERLTKAELEDEAAEIQHVYDEYVEGVDRERTDDSASFANYVSMPAEDWKTTISHLDRASTEMGQTRIWWLRRKFIKRLGDRLEEMEDD